MNMEKVGAEELQATENPYVTRYIKTMGKSFRIDNSKSKKLLGLEYRPLRESVSEMIQYLIQKGVVSRTPEKTIWKKYVILFADLFD